MELTSQINWLHNKRLSKRASSPPLSPQVSGAGLRGGRQITQLPQPRKKQTSLEPHGKKPFIGVDGGAWIRTGKNLGTLVLQLHGNKVCQQPACEEQDSEPRWESQAWLTPHLEPSEAMSRTSRMLSSLPTQRLWDNKCVVSRAAKLRITVTQQQNHVSLVSHWALDAPESYYSQCI